MRNGFGSSWHRRSWLTLIAAGVLALAPACGDDDEAGPDAGARDDTECAAEGYTETCRCSSRQPPGYRQCVSDETGLIWTACTCQPERDAGSRDCMYVGQPVICWPCAGETEGRRTECLQDRTFDCSCRDTGATRDGG